MASYSYRARDASGGLVEGIVEAGDPGAAAAMVQANGLLPVAIRAALADGGGAAAGGPQPSRPALRLPGWPWGGRERVPMEHRIAFSRQMHTLLRSGVPITRALAALNESATHAGFAAVLLDLRQQLEAGRELSQAMTVHDAVFGRFYRSLVRIGEATGRLDEVFRQLFDHLCFEQEMSKRVRSAMRYPGFVMGAIAIALVVINLFVVPSFAKVYRGFHAELPVLTRVLIGTSDFTLRFWPVLLVAAAAAAIAARGWVATPAGRLAWDRIKLRTPLIGPILYRAALSRYARSLALTIRSGASITDGLAASAATIDNVHLSESVAQIGSAVERGESLTLAARRTGVFTPAILQMLAVGEESGNLDEPLSEIAEAYQREVAYELNALADHIEPLLVFVLGMIVLVLALGVFLPMWDLGHAAMGKH